MVIMATKSNLLKLEKEIIPVLKKNNVIKAGLFGSYVRGENKKSSDIDILVKLKPGDGYFELVRLERDLQKHLGKKIDLVTYNSLNHLLRQRILKEEVRII